MSVRCGREPPSIVDVLAVAPGKTLPTLKCKGQVTSRVFGITPGHRELVPDQVERIAPVRF